MSNKLRELTGRMLSDFRFASMFVLVSAALAIFGVPTNWLALLILAFYTLQTGIKQGAKLLPWALLPAVVVMVQTRFAYISLVMMANVMLAYLLPAMLLRFRLWSKVIEFSVFLSVIVIAAVHLLYPDVTQWWNHFMANALTTFFSQMQWKLALSPAQMHQITAITAKLATGMSAVVLIITGLVNLVLARWCQLKYQKHEASVGSELFEVRLGRMVTVLLLLAGIGIYFNVNIAFDIAPVVVLPFAFAGLSVLHVVFNPMRLKWGLLTGLYTLLMFFSPYVIGLLVCVGLIDSWCDLRSRLALHEG